MTLAETIRSIIDPDGSPLSGSTISRLSREHGVSRERIERYSDEYVALLAGARTCNEAMNARPDESGLN